MDAPKTAQDVKIDLLQYAAMHNIDSAILVQAMAETLAAIAIVLDSSGLALPIADRLSDFNKHTDAEYTNIKRSMITNKHLVGVGAGMASGIHRPQ